MAQAQVNPAAGFTLEIGPEVAPAAGSRGHRRRRDPRPGHRRDGSSGLATGHLILTTFHAGSACEVIGRLLDMGIEPYVVRSGLRAVVAQRLADGSVHCSDPLERPDDFLGLPVRSARVPRGCEHCRGTGYRGRTVLAEMLLPEQDELAQAILARSDVRELERVAVAAGMIDRWERPARQSKRA